MITREQVADLQPGDVVELSGHPSQFGSTTRGPLYERDGELYVGDRLVRYVGGSVNHTYAGRLHLTVVSRAPRPLYVNHPRTEPVPGDVVRDAKGVIRFSTVSNDEPAFWSYDYEPGWRWTWTTNPPKPLTLLVDGETGMTVPQ